MLFPGNWGWRVVTEAKMDDRVGYLVDTGVVKAIPCWDGDFDDLYDNLRGRYEVFDRNLGHQVICRIEAAETYIVSGEIGLLKEVDHSIEIYIGTARNVLAAVVGTEIADAWEAECLKEYHKLMPKPNGTE